MSDIKVTDIKITKEIGSDGRMGYLHVGFVDVMLRIHVFDYDKMTEEKFIEFIKVEYVKREKLEKVNKNG